MRQLKKNVYIYIVDHSPQYILSLKKAIDKPNKFIIETFTTGEKYIAHISSNPPRSFDIHIVFLGYHFFDERNHTLMNGIEILEATKVISKEIEVVMLYTPDEATYGAYARNNGAYAFVPKNDTIFLRINNIVMRVISEKNLDWEKRSFMLSVKIFIAYLIILGLVIAVYHIFV